MLWTIPQNNGPGVFLQDNASGPLRSWAEISPQTVAIASNASPLNQGSGLPRTPVLSAAAGGRNKSPVEIPRKSEIPPRN